MTQVDDQAETPAGAEEVARLEVRIARQLLDHAKSRDRVPGRTGWAAGRGERRAFCRLG
jgi:hypothetical protein